MSARRGRRFGRRLLVVSGLGVSIAIPSITSMGTDRLEAANPSAFAMGSSPPGGPHAAGDAEEIFAETIDIHCIDCHRGSGAEGGIDLRAVADAATLHEVATAQIHGGCDAGYLHDALTGAAELMSRIDAIIGEENEQTIARRRSFRG